MWYNQRLITLFTYRDETMQENETIVWIEYEQSVPKKPDRVKCNIKLLRDYALYRNSVYDAYSAIRHHGKSLDDIPKFKKMFEEADNRTEKQHYQDPLYHYSVFACVDAIKEYRSNPDMQCFCAYTTDENNKKMKVGFVHFTTKQLKEKKVVYIAQAGVATGYRSKSIGRKLMQSVLTTVKPDTEVKILTRRFNDPAINLYQKRLGFSPIEQKDIMALGYDERYVGFTLTKTQ